ncbi:MAG: hypothetical protein E6J90_08860 [Deltaproteobacteria bacterium]|nr:MAG: hypothetical protein E6J90_08860 [Deltaproteobacteria bacterium]
MTSANRVQLAWCRETIPGTTNTTPRMRKIRWTGEGLKLFSPEYIDGNEITDDRMTNDPTRIYQGSGGSFNFNLSYPPNLSPESDIIASAMYNEWTLTPERDNDGTADTVITDLGTTVNVATVTTGPAFVVGQLVRFSGNTAPANNLVAKCTTGSATVPAFAGATFTADPAPAATSRMKVVGFQGAVGDITATAAGLGSTVLDFTTLGLQIGQTLKIGNSLVAGEKFTTPALNVYVTVAAVTPILITLGNKPAGWAVDTGAGKTISVYYGDFIKNGILVSTTRVCGTLEEGYLGQATPTYRVGKGMTVDTLTFDFKHKGRIECVANFVGQGGSESTTALDAIPDARSTGNNFASNVNFAKLMEGGVLTGTPNFPRALNIEIKNNLRGIEDVTQDFSPGINEGENETNTKFETYYGSDGTLTKFYNGTPTSFHAVEQVNNQAVSWFLPRQTYRGGGDPNASGKNTDVMLNLEGKASRDVTTAAHCIINRLEFVS